MTEVIVAGGDDDGVDLGDEAERDAFVAAGAAGAHEQSAEHHAAVATEAATAAAAVASEAMNTAADATATAEVAVSAADGIGQLIAAHTAAMQEQTAAISGLVAEIQQSRQSAPPAPTEPVKPKPDREPKSGRKRFRDAYFGNGR